MAREGGWLPNSRMWSQHLPRVNTAVAQLLPPAPGSVCHPARSHPLPLLAPGGPSTAAFLQVPLQDLGGCRPEGRSSPGLASSPSLQGLPCPAWNDLSPQPQTRAPGELQVPMPAPALTGSQALSQ